MNGAQDMGGKHGFGPVKPERDEPVFHADWERRAFALTLAMAAPGGWNIDMSRHARESLPPAQYLSSSYYQIWLAGLEKLVLGAGLVSAAEIAAGRSLEPAKAVERTLGAGDVQAVLRKGGPVERKTETKAQFKPGDKVRTLNLQPIGHTRLPGYARQRQGEITRVHGCHVLPDSNAHGRGEDPHWLYSVRFSARELWGGDASAQDDVFIDLWEPYLESA